MTATPHCYERKCKFYIGVKGDSERSQRNICAAFPSGIPDEIAYGNNLHLTSIKGDRGIQYQREQNIAGADALVEATVASRQ